MITMISKYFHFSPMELVFCDLYVRNGQYQNTNKKTVMEIETTLAAVERSENTTLRNFNHLSRSPVISLGRCHGL